MRKITLSFINVFIFQIVSPSRHFTYILIYLFIYLYHNLHTVFIIIVVANTIILQEFMLSSFRIYIQ